ncbi:IclR family transcriptional regulator [Streptomyces viridiviolaceus]|uniref:IclR family transcriptional regulator n=1 Tax=Streptomyces viridiviolaceus TaxID=68282 RepID=A0ABW2E1L3_9ACTN|nr:IclR family transcriptional regulator [Streptomyces viridiviolaceus]GHB75752.1 IclR family transcriptional regulator [Streptomyces viridiviolaceus]
MAQTVQRAIDILEFCSVRPRRLREIADMCGVHRTTALRLIHTLETSGFVRRDERGLYGVGFRLAALADSALRQFDLRRLVHPHIVELSERVGQTVQFAVPQGDRIIYIDKVEPPSSIRLDTRIGGDVVVQTAGVSKAILAFIDDESRDAILSKAEFRRYTDTTLTSREDFEARLEEVRTNGWSYDDGEYEKISNCVAAPVHDYAGNVAGAISITALSTQLDIEALKGLLPELLKTTTAVSHSLGYTNASQATPQDAAQAP